MRKLPVVAILALTLLLPGRAVLAQNLVVNGSFDSDLAGWVVPSGSQGTANHVPGDGVGAPGAVEFTGLACCTVAISQCVELLPGADYEIGAWVRRASDTPPAQAGDGIGFDVFWSSESACSAQFQASVIELADVTTWTRQLQSLPVPGGALSAIVRMRQYNFAGLTDLRTLADDIVFGPAGTVPVELQRFEVE